MPRTRAMLNLAVSPYHLSTREPVAAIALTLCDRAVTALPEPAEGRTREDVRAAVDRVPRLLRVLEAWRWSGPLWQSGVVGAGEPGDHVFDGVLAAGREVCNDAAFARLAAGAAPPPPASGQTAPRAGDAADLWLDALCADLLRGGPDPRISTTITAAMDRYAASHSCVAVRGPTDSLAQRAEARMTVKIFAVALPVMSRAAGGKILELRASLAEPLGALRAAMADALDRGTAAADAREALHAAAADYGRAFEAWFGRAERDDEADQRTMREFVSITGVALPVDAALLSARAAIQGVSRAAGRRSPSASVPTSKPPSGSVLHALLIRPMNVRPV